MRTITMIVRIAKPSMRYALTTCLVHAFGSSLGAPRPSFSKTSHFDGVTTGAAVGADPCANTGAGTGAGAGLGATIGGATIGGAWTTAGGGAWTTAGGGAATIAGAAAVDACT